MGEVEKMSEHYGVPPRPCPQPAPFAIEAVIVCDKYADFLTYTLPHNKALFDRLVVVTSFEDKATQKVCEYNHVKCVRCDALESRKGVFRKAEGINDGLAELSGNDWVVHLDADIYLPPQTRNLLALADLDRSMIYGADRFMVRGAKAWHDFLENPVLQHENETWIHTHAFPIGTRVMQAAGNGYIPIGFFQLWHPKGSGIAKYPENHTDAGRTDILFAEQWPRAKRTMLPEIICYHLESDDADFGGNWKGRKTAQFTR